jgi:hypothetical protein
MEDQNNHLISEVSHSNKLTSEYQKVKTGLEKEIKGLEKDLEKLRKDLAKEKEANKSSIGVMLKKNYDKI